MSEIDYEELDKEVEKAMMKSPKETEAPEAVEVHEQPKSAVVKPRGRYMDMVHPRSDMRPPARNYSAGKNIDAPEKVAAIAEKPVAKKPVADEPEFGVIENVDRKSGAAADDFVGETKPMKGLKAAEPGYEFIDDEVPNGNNYSLGGRSPFIPDAQVEKRPLGNYVPDGSVRGVQSTKNVYSQRTPVGAGKADVAEAQAVMSEMRQRRAW